MDYYDYELRHTEEREGFTVKFYTAPEYKRPDWPFESKEAKQELLNKIDYGLGEWVTSKVTAERYGVILSTGYLGARYYEFIEDFIKPGTCYEDIVAQVIQGAKETLIKLNKG